MFEPVENAISCARRGENIPKEQWLTLTPAERGRVAMHQPGFNRKIKDAADRRMKIMDEWPSDVRAAANDIGFAIVHGFWTAGVKKGNLIRHLVALARFQQVDGRPAGYGNHRVGQ